MNGNIIEVFLFIILCSFFINYKAINIFNQQNNSADSLLSVFILLQWILCNIIMVKNAILFITLSYGDGIYN